MSENKELQDEEREALISIYEGDPAFKQVNSTTFQYKYGEDNDYKSFLVEIIWGEKYPDELPTINLDTFYNRDLILSIKSKIMAVLVDEAEQWLGSGMTYTLFESVKDRTEELLRDQPEPIASVPDFLLDVDQLNIGDAAKKLQPKKEQLTKAQKRRQWERTDHKGERARGWNWVDIIKHLSQTGGSKDDTSSSQSAPVETS